MISSVYIEDPEEFENHCKSKTLTYYIDTEFYSMCLDSEHPIAKAFKKFAKEAEKYRIN